MLASVEWGEFSVSDLFELKKITKMLSKEHLSGEFLHPVYSSESTNNGIVGYTDCPEFICNSEHPVYITFGDHTRTFNLAKKSFSVLDNVKVLLPKIQSERGLLFIITEWQKQIPNLGYSRHWKVAKICMLRLPTKNGQLALDFMEKFVAELEARRVAELEAYLAAAGLKDCALTAAEEAALRRVQLVAPEHIGAAETGERCNKLHPTETVCWKKFNLQKLFGKATRGKRLKSADRISGSLPFVTAGEADTGISAFIGNNVEVFKSNTVTIDMFGSAKYRNYEYGGDDHIAVVHTDQLPQMAVLFITAAIHKAAYTGEFHYGRNFYAKDADKLNILLPEKDGQPDYGFMQTLLSAVQKTVIQDVVQYADRKIAATQAVIARNGQRPSDTEAG